MFVGIESTCDTITIVSGSRQSMEFWLYVHLVSMVTLCAVALLSVFVDTEEDCLKSQEAVLCFIRSTRRDNASECW